MRVEQGQLRGVIDVLGVSRENGNILYWGYRGIIFPYSLLTRGGWCNCRARTKKQWSHLECRKRSRSIFSSSTDKTKEEVFKASMGSPKIRGTILGVPFIRIIVLGYILGSSYFGKLPYRDYRDTISA